jgi:hypothetical protein
MQKHVFLMLICDKIVSPNVYLPLPKGIGQCACIVFCADLTCIGFIPDLRNAQVSRGRQLMDDSTRQFFSPRSHAVQGRLNFIDVPPIRKLFIQGPLAELVGVNLHFVRGRSVLCPGEESCDIDHGEFPVRENYYCGAYLISDELAVVHAGILSLGADLSALADKDLSHCAYIVRPKYSKDGRKNGLTFAAATLTLEHTSAIRELGVINVAKRIRQRFHS